MLNSSFLFLAKPSYIIMLYFICILYLMVTIQKYTFCSVFSRNDILEIEIEIKPNVRFGIAEVTFQIEFSK